MADDKADMWALVKWLRERITEERQHADQVLLDTYCRARTRKALEWRNYARWVDNEPERQYLPRFLSGPPDGTIPGLELAVRIRATAYQDHPGYLEAWRP